LSLKDFDYSTLSTRLSLLVVFVIPHSTKLSSPFLLLVQINYADIIRFSRDFPTQERRKILTILSIIGKRKNFLIDDPE